jgi:hypothetical protein
MHMVPADKPAWTVLIFSLLTCGCSSRPIPPSEFERAMSEARGDCVRSAYREAWRRKWDERYMRPEIEHACDPQGHVWIARASLR